MTCAIYILQDLVGKVSKSMIIQADLASIENMNERLCFATHRAFISKGFSPRLVVFQMRESVKGSFQGKFENQIGQGTHALLLTRWPHIGLCLIYYILLAQTHTRTHTHTHTHTHAHTHYMYTLIGMQVNFSQSLIFI